MKDRGAALADGVAQPVGDGTIHMIVGTNFACFGNAIEQLPVMSPNMEGPVAVYSKLGWLAESPENSEEIDSEAENN